MEVSNLIMGCMRINALTEKELNVLVNTASENVKAILPKLWV